MTSTRSTQASEPGMGFARTAARGVAVTLLGQVGKVAIQLGSIAALARLVSPEEFGIFAMVVAITGIAEVLRDAGLSAAAIQAGTISHGQKSNLFWINTALGSVLTLVTIAAAPLVADFYGQPQVVHAMQLVSVVFVLNGVAAQCKAHLLRSLKFRAVAITDVLSQTLGLMVAVAFAVAGLGYWALAIQPVAVSLGALLLFAAWAQWRPSRPRGSQQMAPLLKYGINYMGTQVLVFASSNLGAVIVGKNFGPSSIAYYSRAFQLFSMPVNQLSAPATNVALPVLSRISADVDSFRSYVLRAQTVLCYASLGIFAYLFAAAPSVVWVMLGPGWEPVIPLLRAFALAGAFQILGMSTYWVFISKGLTGSNLRFALVTRSFLIGVVALSSLHGPFACALAFSVGTFLIWGIGLWWIRHVDRRMIRQLINVTSRSVLIFAVASAVSYVATDRIDSLWAAIVLPPPIIIAVILLIGLVVPPVRKDMKSLYATIRLVKK